MPSRNSSSSPERPAKRSKVFRACQACVTAKTRCEDVQLEGCYLCRRKHKECSLRGISALATATGPAASGSSRERLDSFTGEPTPHHQRYQRYDTPRSSRGGGGDTHNGDAILLLDRLRVQEERYRELEERLNHLEADQRETRERERETLKRLNSGNERNLTSGSLYNGSPLDVVPGAGGGNRGRQVIVPDYSIVRSFKKSLAPTFDEGLFCPVNPAAYPDPVAMGIVTRPQMEMAFQFPFLRSSTPTPDHAFVRLAVLFYLNHIPPIDMAELVEQSLSILIAGAVSAQSLLALFIMSLGPAQPCLETYAQPSALRLISLAYHIGLDLGIGRQVELALRDKESLLQSWAEEKMELTLLWTAIVNRYNILHILCTPTASLVPSPAPMLPDHSVDGVKHTVAHLQSEAELVGIASSLIDTLIVAEDAWTEERLKVCAEHLSSTRQELEAFRKGLSTQQQETSLMYDAKCTDMSMVFRLASFNQNLPSPINPEIRRPGLHAIGMNFFPSSKMMSDLAASIDTSDPPLIPMYVLTAASLALIGLRRAAIHSAAVHPELQIVDIEALQRCELKIHQLGGSPSLVLTQADEQFGKWPEVYRKQLQTEESHAQHLNGNSGEGSGPGSTDSSFTHARQNTRTDGYVIHQSPLDPLSTTTSLPTYQPGDMFDFSAVGWDWMNMLFDPPNVNPYAHANTNTQSNTNVSLGDAQLPEGRL
ncbi:hypothetical protein I317_02357 [Kwoniella heveanensis CBS 569]|nr:hypothetical protein I317_02357 [Kwoniella heveanensis CBS 569]